MNPVSEVRAQSRHLEDRWLATRAEWNDGSAADFESHYWEELRQETEAISAAAEEAVAACVRAAQEAGI